LRIRSQEVDGVRARRRKLLRALFFAFERASLGAEEAAEKATIQGESWKNIIRG
jgi:hypothetical protein